MAVLSDSKQNEVKAGELAWWDLKEPGQITFISPGRGPGRGPEAGCLYRDRVDILRGELFDGEQRLLQQSAVAVRMIERQKPFVGKKEMGPFPREIDAGFCHACVKRDRGFPPGESNSEEALPTDRLRRNLTPASAEKGRCLFLVSEDVHPFPVVHGRIPNSIVSSAPGLTFEASMSWRAVAEGPARERGGSYPLIQ